jgi:hypothetical protein
MLIEDLIRLGRPLLEGGLLPEDILNIITDVGETRAKNFFRNIFLAELPTEIGHAPAVWWQQLGQELDHEGKKDFRVDINRAVGIPFSLPAGGNPLHPQGRYGLPAYPCWSPHLQGFRDSPDGVRDFLKGRLERTPGLKLSAEILDALCQRIHEEAKRAFGATDQKRLGVLVLIDCSPDGFYTYGRRRNSPTTLGESQHVPGRFVEPNLERILEAVWSARLEEGAEIGERAEATCSISGASGRVVSSYCKAWPWAFPTWTCPVPHAGDTALMVEGIRLDAGSYRALTMGACVFNRLVKKVRSFIIHEVFSPTADSQGREIARGRKAIDLAAVFGAAFLLPVEDRFFRDDDFKSLFAKRMLSLFTPPVMNGTQADRQLESVTGFECFIPEEFNQNEFHLTLVYFSGEPSRGDIHLRAYIQDVLPSVAAKLKSCAVKIAQEASQLFEIVHLAEKRRVYLYSCYKSVPYLLARGYGGPHLWHQLEQALHRRPLGVKRVLANSAARMESLSHRLPDSRYDLAEEAIFYLSCREFIRNCNVGLTNTPQEEHMPMRPWRELLDAIEKGPIDQLHYDGASELGFGCGALVRQFSSLYWTATKAGEEGKDYLKHRVLTFGADLTPDVVWKSALKQMFEVAKRYEDIRSRFETFLQERVGATMMEFHRLQDQVRSSRDEFMTAFWAGYSLQGYDHRNKTKADKDKNGPTTEGGAT